MAVGEEQLVARQEEPRAGEPYWPAQLAVVIALLLSALLPGKLTLGPPWLLPGLEGMLLLGLAVTTPRRGHPEHPLRRPAAIPLIAGGNPTHPVSLVLLSDLLLHRRGTTNGR